MASESTPISVHIKRKASDEPVDYLRLQDVNGKRQKIGFVFRRLQTPSSDSAQPPSHITHHSPALASVQEAASNPSRDYNKRKDVEEGSDKGHGVPNADESALSSKVRSHQRQYRLTRVKEPTYGPSSDGGIRKIPRSTLFVERKLQQSLSRQSSSQSLSATSTDPKTEVTGEISTPPVKHVYAQQKKPGRTSCVKPAQSTSNLAGDVPTLATIENVKLVAELEAFCLQDLERGIVNHQKPAPADSVPASTHMSQRGTPQRFKPKVPVLRWAERNPEAAAAIEREKAEEYANARQKSLLKKQKAAEAIEDHQQEADGDYVIDTYTRVPIESVATESGQFGVLVLDDEDDMEMFYGEDDQDDEDEGLGDEDENAENHYTADYPEDEVDSDDEYGRAPYQYDKHRHEFDEGAFSEDEVDNMRYPWDNNATKQTSWTDDMSD